MATNHATNGIPILDYEEHSRIGGLDGKKTFIFDNAGNQITNFGGTFSGNVTLAPSPNFVGIVTVANPSSFTGNITLDQGSKTGIVGNVTLSDSKGYIGLTTITIGGGALASAATIYAIVNTAAAGQASVVLDNSIAKIGFATVAIASGNVGITGNVTLSDSKTYIGLVTATLGSSPSIQAFGQYMPIMPSIASGGLGPVAVDLNGRLITSIFTIADPKGFIGNVTVTGNVGITGNVTLSDAKTFIGLTTSTLGASPAFVGIVTITNQPPLTAGTANIGFATVTQAFPSGATVYTQIISLTSTTTICVAPASNLFFLKNLHVTSLGRSEVEIRSGATTLIPFTSLSTTSGFFEHYGEYGLSSRAQADGLVVNLAVGSATIAIMANVRFGV